MESNTNYITLTGDYIINNPEITDGLVVKKRFHRSKDNKVIFINYKINISDNRLYRLYDDYYRMNIIGDSYQIKEFDDYFMECNNINHDGIIKEIHGLFEIDKTNYYICAFVIHNNLVYHCSNNSINYYETIYPEYEYNGYAINYTLEYWFNNLPCVDKLRNKKESY